MFNINDTVPTETFNSQIIILSKIVYIEDNIARIEDYYYTGQYLGCRHISLKMLTKLKKEALCKIRN